MNPQLKALLDKIAAKNKEAQDLLAKTDATADDVTAAKAIIDVELPALKVQAEAFQSVDALKAASAAFDTYLKTPVTQLPQANATTAAGATKANVGVTEIDMNTGEVVTESGAGVLTRQQIKAVVNPEYSEGFTAWARSGGDESKMKATKSATDAFLEGRDSEGGHFVPPEIIAGIIRRDPAPTRIVDFVRTIPVGSDQAQLVKANYDSDDLYSSAVRIYKTGEAQAAQKSGKPQFGLQRVDVHGWTAEISISKRFLDDTSFDLMGYLAEEMRTACRNMTAQKIVLGSGVGEHFGILTRAGVAGKGPDIVKSGDANLLTWDSLRKIKNAVPEQYDQNARFLFNKKSTLDAIEAFKDADNRDLWPEAQRAGGVAGAPGTLRGYSYALEAFMPDIAANAYPILFGDFTGYGRVLRLGMTIQVLREIEARNGQVVFLLEIREGGDVIEPWRLKILKISA